MVVARARGRGAQQLLVVVDRLDDAGEEHQEAKVLHRALARVEQVLAVCRDRPVVVLAGPVDALEGLLVQKAHQAVVAGEQAHLLHREQVLVDGAVGVGEDGRELIRRGHLVVLGLGGDAERPELVVELFHELVDGRADGAVVVLLELLALARRPAEQGASREHQVLAAGVLVFGDEEELLPEPTVVMTRRLGSPNSASTRLACSSTACIERERRLLVERLAGVAAERGGDAEHLIFDESIARGSHAV